MINAHTPAAVYWRVAVPSTLPDDPQAHAMVLAGHYAAMAHAHLRAYGDLLVHGPQTPEALRAIVSTHFDPGVAAFAAAAAIRGHSPAWIVDAIESGDTMHECVWGWVAEVLDAPDPVVDGLLSSLSPPALGVPVATTNGSEL